MFGVLFLALLLVLAGYGALLLALWLGQRGLLYKPDRERPMLPDDPPAGFQELTSTTADGLSLTHWYVPPPKTGAPVVVIFHGNAGHRGSAFEKFRPIAGWRYGLLIADYRGYGGNPGVPSEDGLLADARSALDALGPAAERAVLYGESLGSGVAVALAAERPVAGVILEAPFTSIADVAQTHYWYTPAKWLVRDRFDSLTRIGRIGAPLLVLHGGRDDTIPPRLGRRLHETASEPKRLWFHAEANHIDLWERGADRAVRAFVSELAPAHAPER